jgi:N-acetylneuraminate synthase
VKTVEFAGRKVGTGQPCFIIAEAGVNHNGDVALAERLVDAAVRAGADAVKFQTFEAERLISAAAPKAEYQLRAGDPRESQLDMVRRLELSPEEYRQLAAYCERRRILFLSTPFDRKSVDLLVELGVPALKVGSGEITHWPFLEHVARSGLPIILSTGMAHLGEVDEAVRVVQSAGNGELALLHCVSNYPADPEDANLRAMRTMAVAFQLPVGYSDHTLGIEVSLAAVALGACIIEKHFTLDRDLPGPDHRASLEPRELAALVRGIRIVESALGHGLKCPAPSEANTTAVARRSLVAAQDIPTGTTLTAGMVAIKRPGTGLPASFLPHVVGRTVRVEVLAGSLLRFDMLD